MSSHLRSAAILATAGVIGTACFLAYRRRAKQPKQLGEGSKTQSSRVTTLVFDIDDTLYPITNGFTDHRINECVLSFMVNRLGFEDEAKAQAFRAVWFKKYHSSLKMLTAASDEGALPPKPDGSARVFDPVAFVEYYLEFLEFDKYLTPCPATIAALGELKATGLKMVIMTNGPRNYGIKVLETLGLAEFFEPELIFAIEDVMPSFKPEPAAFSQVLAAAGCDDPTTAVMFEDSMKNIRGAKAIGMKTVLLLAVQNGQGDQAIDAPDPQDQAVDAVLRVSGDIKKRLPCLWNKEWRV